VTRRRRVVRLLAFVVFQIVVSAALVEGAVALLLTHPPRT